jgi:hypothetical protein
MQLMRERGVTSLDQWFSDFVETDWRYVERFYQTDTLPKWEDCNRARCGHGRSNANSGRSNTRQVEVRFAF